MQFPRPSFSLFHNLHRQLLAHDPEHDDPQRLAVLEPLSDLGLRRLELDVPVTDGLVDVGQCNVLLRLAVVLDF